jgi:hypothetical protein
LQHAKESFELCHQFNKKHKILLPINQFRNHFQCETIPFEF